MGASDLRCVPIDKIGGNNLGYGFVSFVGSASCQRFKVIDAEGSQVLPRRAQQQWRCVSAMPMGQGRLRQDMNMLSKGMKATSPKLPASTYSMPAEAAATAESAESSAEPSLSASSFTGFRKDAPEFVPSPAVST